MSLPTEYLTSPNQLEIEGSNIGIFGGTFRIQDTTSSKNAIPKEIRRDILGFQILAALIFK